MTEHLEDPHGGFDGLALEKSEASRARTLLDSLAAKSLSPAKVGRAKTSSELARLRDALNRAYETRLNLIVRGSSNQEIQRNAGEIRRLSSEYDRTQDMELQSNSFESPRHRDAVRPLSLSQLLDESRKSNSVFLEYALGERRGYLWRIEHGELTTAILPDSKHVITAVQQWRDLMAARQRRPGESFPAYRQRVEDSDRQLPKQSAEVSCMLLPHMHLAEDSRVVIVASGILQSLPFGALPVDGCEQKDERPLMAAYEIVNAPSISVVAAAGTGASAQTFNGDVAILADPVFSAADARVANHVKAHGRAASPSALQSALRDVGFGTELPRLRATREEAEAISAALPSARLLVAMDFNANLHTALSQEMDQYRIWHFATHGLLDSKSPDLSGIVFSLVDQQGHPTPGYLKMQDIYGMSIRTDLIVLSACNSGLGEEVDGEGTVGLSYAFLHAGAKQVISTLWNIDDRASSELMAQFYRALLTDHLTPSAALRRAQMAMLKTKSNANAFYWAGYVINSASP